MDKQCVKTIVERVKANYMNYDMNHSLPFQSDENNFDPQISHQSMNVKNFDALKENLNPELLITSDDNYIQIMRSMDLPTSFEDSSFNLLREEPSATYINSQYETVENNFLGTQEISISTWPNCSVEQGLKLIQPDFLTHANVEADKSELKFKEIVPIPNSILPKQTDIYTTAHDLVSEHGVPLKEFDFTENLMNCSDKQILKLLLQASDLTNVSVEAHRPEQNFEELNKLATPDIVLPKQADEASIADSVLGSEPGEVILPELDLAKEAVEFIIPELDLAKEAVEFIIPELDLTEEPLDFPVPMLHQDKHASFFPGKSIVNYKNKISINIPKKCKIHNVDTKTNQDLNVFLQTVNAVQKTVTDDILKNSTYFASRSKKYYEKLQSSELPIEAKETSEEVRKLEITKEPVEVIIPELDLTEEPVDFPVPVLHQDENLNLLSSDKNESLKSQGIVIREGKWSIAETNLLRRNLQDFQSRFGIYDVNLLLGLGRKLPIYKDKNNQISKFLKVKHFYLRLGKDINERTIRSIYEKAQGIFNTLKRRKDCTPNDVTAIMQLQRKYGTDWNLIGQILGIYSKVCCRIYMDKKKAVVKGKWSYDEKEKLISAIKSIINVTELNDENIKGISWERVSELVSTRNAKQCYNEWKRNISKVVKNVSYKKWDPSHSAKLIFLLKNKYPVTDECFIPWKELQRYFGNITHSEFALREKWYKIKQCLPEELKTNFSELIIFCYKKYSKYLNQDNF